MVQRGKCVQAIGLTILVLSLSLLSLTGTMKEKGISQPFSTSLGLADGLILHWPLDESAGDIVFDVTGNHLHGSIRGAGWVEGKLGSALEFDGANDYVHLHHEEALDITEDISIVLWIYLADGPDTTKANDYRILMGRWSFPKPYGLILEESRMINGSVFINGTRQRVVSRTQMPLRQWQHVAFTYDANAGEGKIYINGNLANSIKGSQGTIDKSDSRLQISRFNPPDVHRAWPGRVDDVRIYNRVLNSDEIATLAQLN